MEYMLLRDGSVKAFESLPMHQDVLDAMHDYDGVAHYWWNENFKWSCIEPDSLNLGSHQVRDDDVPEVIRLAAMLS